MGFVSERLLPPPSLIGEVAARPSAVGATLTTVTVPVYSARPPSSSRIFSLTEREPSRCSARLAGKDELVAPGEVLALEQPRERLRDLGHHRHRPSAPALGRADVAGAVVVAPHHADRLGLEVDVADAEREELAETEPGEGGRQEERAVLLSLGRADERPHLLGRVEVVVLGHVPDPQPSTSSAGFDGRSCVLRARSKIACSIARSFTAVRSGSGPSLVGHLLRPPALDRHARDRLDRHRPKWGRSHLSSADR